MITFAFYLRCLLMKSYLFYEIRKCNHWRNNFLILLVNNFLVCKVTMKMIVSNYLLFVLSFSLSSISNSCFIQYGVIGFFFQVRQRILWQTLRLSLRIIVKNWYTFWVSWLPMKYICKNLNFNSVLTFANSVGSEKWDTSESDSFHSLLSFSFAHRSRKTKKHKIYLHTK